MTTDKHRFREVGKCWRDSAAGDGAVLLIRDLLLLELGHCAAVCHSLALYTVLEMNAIVGFQILSHLWISGCGTIDNIRRKYSGRRRCATANVALVSATCGPTNHTPGVLVAGFTGTASDTLR